MKNIYQRALDCFGYNPQIIKTIEEMAELQKQLCKDLNKDPKTNLYSIREEIADVYIMLAQMAEVYGKDDIKSLIKKKRKAIESKMKNWITIK